MTEVRLPPELLREAVRKYGSAGLEVSGRSMWPLVPPGATVHLEPIDRHELKPGLVVALARGNHTVCHMVVRVCRDSGAVTTKGLTRSVLDAPSAASDLIGVVSRVEWGPLAWRPGSALWRALSGLARFVGWLSGFTSKAA